MQTAIVHTKEKKKALLTLVVAALSVPLFLGFIDEGYYNFQFLLDPGSLVALSIYGALIFGFEYLFYAVIFKKSTFQGKLITSISFGILTGFFAAIVFFLSVKHLF